MGAFSKENTEIKEQRTSFSQLLLSIDYCDDCDSVSNSSIDEEEDSFDLEPK